MVESATGSEHYFHVGVDYMHKMSLLLYLRDIIEIGVLRNHTGGGGGGQCFRQNTYDEKMGLVHLWWKFSCPSLQNTRVRGCG